MPEDLMWSYCRRICGNLRDKINAEIYVNSCDNEIVTDIYWGEFQFECVIIQMHKLVYRGVSSEEIARYIYKKYKSALLEEAFI